MRTATNQVGHNIEVLTPAYGWRVVGFGPPHDTVEQAKAAMVELQAAAPDREFRTYPSLKGRHE